MHICMHETAWIRLDSGTNNDQKPFKLKIETKKWRLALEKRITEKNGMRRQRLTNEILRFSVFKCLSEIFNAITTSDHWASA